MLNELTLRHKITLAEVTDSILDSMDFNDLYGFISYAIEDGYTSLEGSCETIRDLLDFTGDEVMKKWVVPPTGEYNDLFENAPDELTTEWFEDNKMDPGDIRIECSLLSDPTRSKVIIVDNDIFQSHFG